MNVFSKVALAVAGSLVVSTAVMAQGAPQQTPEQQAAAAVKARKAVFDVISMANGPIGALARPNAPAPDAAAVTKAAQRLQALAPMISEAFARDTHGVTGDTKARDAIWTNKADFDAKAAELGKAAAALEAAAKSGGDIKAVAGNVGKTCGGCHDQYRDK
jgi:cytochrome c556